MSALFDRLGRVVLLVVSALATLALITAIASVSSRAPGGGGEARYPPQPIGRDAVPSDPRQASFADVPWTPPGKVSPPVAQAIAQREQVAATRAVADRLAALTWAVAALAGFVAAGVVVLLRMTALLARRADRG